MVKEIIPPFNILITSVLLGAVNIFLFLLQAPHPIYLLLFFELPEANFLRSSYAICFAPWITTSGKHNKSLHPYCGSHCELEEYCLAYNNVWLVLISHFLMRKSWLKLILLSGPRTLPDVPSSSTQNRLKS